MSPSKPKRKGGVPSRRRDKAAETRARETKAAQQRSESKKLTLAAYRKRRVLGWSLVAFGVLVGVQHVVAHMGFFQVISSGWDDLVVGYPMAGLLGVSGAIVLSRT